MNDWMRYWIGASWMMVSVGLLAYGNATHHQLIGFVGGFFIGLGYGWAFLHGRKGAA